MDKIKGLGDVIFIITKYTGIRWLVKKVWGEDCGCDERQEIPNDLVPFKENERVIQKPKPTPKL